MQIHVMRHGQTNYNLLHLCNDVIEKNVSLTATGKQQALAVAAKLQHIVFDIIIVSPLPRTRQTADIVNQQRRIEIISHPGIQDIRSGFDSLPVKDYQQAIAHDRLNARINGGESLLQHQQRVLNFLSWLRQQAFASVLVIAHEETLRVVKAHFENLDAAAMMDLNFDNCAVLQYTG